MLSHIDELTVPVDLPFSVYSQTIKLIYADGSHALGPGRFVWRLQWDFFKLCRTL